MLLLATMAFGQAKEDAGDGKMLDKQTMEFKDYLPEIHGTIRGKYEYQTETSESRFEELSPLPAAFCGIKTTFPNCRRAIPNLPSLVAI